LTELVLCIAADGNKDIADVVAFVVSEETRWWTGQNIHAVGGVVM
jgi:NAD(P)-dependent dehydrogenase (short-subunit alcohol dehydrogenase family)